MAKNIIQFDGLVKMKLKDAREKYVRR